MGYNPEEDSFLNFSTGVGDILYPPHTLHEEVFKEDMFLDVCRYADDIWFYAMAFKNGTHTRKGFTYNNSGDDYTMNWNVQDMGLCQINWQKRGKQSLNDIQLKTVVDKYNLYEKLK